MTACETLCNSLSPLLEGMVLVVYYLIVALFCVVLVFLATWIYYRITQFRFNRRFLKDTWRRAMELEAIDRREAKKGGVGKE